MRAGPPEQPEYRLGFRSAVRNVGARPADHRRAPAGADHRHDGRRPGRRATTARRARGCATSGGCASSSRPTTGTGTCSTSSATSCAARTAPSALVERPQDRLLPRRPLRVAAGVRRARRPGVPDAAAASEQTRLLGIREGISVGYGDDYAANLEGQYLPLTGVADGRYVLVHRVNADRRIRELATTTTSPRSCSRCAGGSASPTSACSPAAPTARAARCAVIVIAVRAIATPSCGRANASGAGPRPAPNRSRRRPHGPLPPPPPAALLVLCAAATLFAAAPALATEGPAAPPPGAQLPTGLSPVGFTPFANPPSLTPQTAGRLIRRARLVHRRVRQGTPRASAHLARVAEPPAHRDDPAGWRRPRRRERAGARAHRVGAPAARRRRARPCAPAATPSASWRSTPRGPDGPDPAHDDRAPAVAPIDADPRARLRRRARRALHDAPAARVIGACD